MKQRPNGTGTIERTPTGRFRARFAFDGKKREAIEGSPFATYEEAEAALDGILALLASSPVEGLTLLRLGEKCLARRDREGYRSIDDSRSMWSAYVEPWELAKMPAKTITRGDLRDLLASLRTKKRKPLATQTKRNVRNLLNSVFAYGCDAELLDANPCRDIKIRSMGSTIETSTFLTLEESLALIGAATDPAVAIAIGAGIRSGELRSLRWEDVHLGTKKPHVVIRYGKPGEPAKNGKIRSVDLFGVALEAFERMAAARAAAKLARGRRAMTTAEETADAIVLPSFSGWYRQKGRVVDPKSWKAWKLAAGLERPVRWHDLRHTCATLLLCGAWGRAWSYEEVKEMLGHSSVKVTERYAHAVGTLAGRAAAEMRARAIALRPEPESLPTSCPPSEEAIMVQAAGIVQRCGWDLNPHMPVLQTWHKRGEDRDEAPDMGSAWAAAETYARAVLRRDPHAHARGLDLAEAVLDLAATSTSSSRRSSAS